LFLIIDRPFLALKNQKQNAGQLNQHLSESCYNFRIASTNEENHKSLLAKASPIDLKRKKVAGFNSTLNGRF